MQGLPELPYILRFEEAPDEDAMIDGLETEYYRDPRLCGMQLRNPFLPWDAHLGLKEI